MAESKILKLHVGYGKTGSSSLQSWLSANTVLLSSFGVQYPLPPDGQSDSGNGHLLLKALEASEAEPLVDPALHVRCVLLSREQLARELIQPEACRRLALWAESVGFEEIHALLLVRDPQEHCYSLWAQKVKRAGETRSLQAFRESYDATRMATQFLQAAQLAGIRVTVRDYGLWRQDLLELLLPWLGLRPLQTEVLKQKMSIPTWVNPTPSHQQVQLQRILNRLRPEALRGRSLVPPRCVADLVPSRSPSSLSSALRARWMAEVDLFNSVAEAISDDAQRMPFHQHDY